MGVGALGAFTGTTIILGYFAKSENLSQEEFKNFCFSIFEDNKFVGILYSLVRVLEIDNAVEEARKIVSDWVEEDPFNEELILLKDYLNNSNQLY